MSTIINSLIKDQNAQLQLFLTFLGAVLAIYFVLVTNMIKNWNKKRLIENSFKDELKMIRDELIAKKELPPYFRYSYSIWEIMNNSGDLPSLIGVEKSKQYFKIYTKISFASQLESEYYNLYIRHDKNAKEMLEKLKEERVKMKDQLISYINELLD